MIGALRQPATSFDFFGRMPDELSFVILSHIPFLDLSNVGISCRKFSCLLKKLDLSHEFEVLRKITDVIQPGLIKKNTVPTWTSLSVGVRKFQTLLSQCKVDELAELSLDVSERGKIYWEIQDQIIHAWRQLLSCKSGYDGIFELSESLSFNDYSFQALLSAIKVSNIGTLKIACPLWHNQTLLLAEALKENQTIKHLEVNLGRCNPKGIKALTEMLKTNACLKSIALQKLTENEVKIFFEELPNTQLEAITLKRSEFLEEASLALIELIKLSVSLKTINIKSSIYPSAQREFTEAIKNHRNVKVVMQF